MPAIGSPLRFALTAAAVVSLLGGCGERNTYQPPPPAEVTVAKPGAAPRHALHGGDRQHARRSTSVDLVARVQGFLDKVGYKDGAAVKKGDLLFQIDKQDYEIAPADRRGDAGAAGSAAAAGRRRPEAQAGPRQDSRRVGRPGSTNSGPSATPRSPRSRRPRARSSRPSSTSPTRPSSRRSTASSRRAWSIPAPWSAPAAPTKLATIVQIDPIYVELQHRRAAGAADPRALRTPA